MILVLLLGDMKRRQDHVSRRPMNRQGCTPPAHHDVQNTTITWSSTERSHFCHSLEWRQFIYIYGVVKLALARTTQVMLVPCVLLATSLALTSVHAQRSQAPPNSFPHNYPGIPNTNNNYQDSKAWQDCEQKPVSFSPQNLNAVLDFLVSDPLPNMTFTLERSFAGNLPVNRQGHPNDTLFFWAFEKTNGSLTRDANESTTESVSFRLISFLFRRVHCRSYAMI